MLQIATQFFRQWRFTVSEQKSQVVAFGPGETQTLRDREWQLGGVTIWDVQHYKYLGLLFEKGGRWHCMQTSNIDKAQHGYQQLYQIGFGDARLQVGQLAFLWSLLARSKLIYGAEVWLPNSETKIKELEQIQAQAAKKAFGKAAAATVIAEAALGDLGWPSVQSQILDSKLRFYGYLSHLPKLG
jgi:hypothetical protein